MCCCTIADHSAAQAAQAAAATAAGHDAGGEAGVAYGAAGRAACGIEGGACGVAVDEEGQMGNQVEQLVRHVGHHVTACGAVPACAGASDPEPEP